MSDFKLYLVTVDTTKGFMDVELLGTSSQRAADRARMTLVHAREYGDIDQVQWVSVEEVICRYFAACDRTAVRLVQVADMEVPTCQRCYDKAESFKPSGHTFDGMPACGKDVDGQGRLCNDDPGHEGGCTI